MPPMNPGYAFSQAFVDEIASSEARRRQALMDDLAIKREQRLQKSDEMDLQTRQQQVKEKEAEAFVKNYQTTHIKGDIPDADTIKKAKDLGVDWLFRDQPGAQTLPSTQTGGIMRLAPASAGEVGPAQVTASPAVPTGPPIRTYQGSVKEQERAQLQPLMDKISGADPDSPDYRKAVLQYELETGRSIPSSLIRVAPATTKPTTKAVYTFNPRTGRVEKATDVDANATIERMATPAENQGASSGTDELASSGGLSDAGITMEAIRVRETGLQPPIGRTKEGAKLYTAIVNRAAELQKDPNGVWTYKGNPVNQPSLAQAGSDYRTDAASQAALQKNLDAASAFFKTAEDNARLLSSAVAKIPDTGIPFLNAPLRSASTALGSDTMTAFNAVRQSVQNEYARILTQPGLTGVLSDAARKEVETILDSNSTPKQIEAALKQLQAESSNRVKDYQTQVDAIRKRSTGASPRGGDGTTDAPKADPKAIFQDILKSVTGGK